MENTLPPEKWEKTKWLKPQDSDRPWWEFIGREFSQVCCLKARIKKIVFLSAVTQARWLNGEIDDILPYVMEEAFVEVQWNTDAYIPEELLKHNLITKCIYDCGLFHTAKREFNLWGTIDDPFIHGFQNIPWFAFTDEKRTGEPDTFSPFDDNQYSDEDLAVYLSLYPLADSDIPADIVLVLYDANSKRKSILITDRLILVGHSHYDGIDGKDNDAFKFSSVGGLSLSGLVNSLRMSQTQFMVYRNGYVHIVLFDDSVDYPTSPDEYAKDIFVALPTNGNVASLYQLNNYYHSYFENTSLDLSKKNEFKFLLNEDSTYTLPRTREYALKLWINNKSIPMRFAPALQRDVWTQQGIKLTDGVYEDAVLAGIKSASIFTGELHIYGICSVKMLSESEIIFTVICSDVLDATEPDKADTYVLMLTVNIPKLAQEDITGICTTSTSLKNILVYNSQYLEGITKSTGSGHRNDTSAESILIGSFEDKDLVYSATQDTQTSWEGESPGQINNTVDYVGELKFNNIVLYTDLRKGSLDYTSDSIPTEYFITALHNINTPYVGLKQYTENWAYTTNILLSAYLEEEVFQWLEVTRIPGGPVYINRIISIKGVKTAIENMIQVNGYAYILLPSQISHKINSFYITIPGSGPGNPPDADVPYEAVGRPNQSYPIGNFRLRNNLDYFRLPMEDHNTEGGYKIISLLDTKVDTDVYDYLWEPYLASFGAGYPGGLNKHSRRVLMLRATPNGEAQQIISEEAVEYMQFSEDQRLVLLHSKRLDNPLAERNFLFFDGALINDNFDTSDNLWNKKII